MSSSKSDYLNPQQVKAKSTSNSNDTVAVKCYSNGVFDVCPNPLKPSKSQGVEEAYDMCHYISYNVHYLSQKDFNDQSNWNS